MTTTELYGQIGGDYADVLKRFNSDAMVKRFAIKFLKDESFEKLCIAMEERNTDTAFRAAHTLKGICLNLGFGDLYRVSSAITEALRRGDMSSAARMLDALRYEYRRLTELIGRLDGQ